MAVATEENYRLRGGYPTPETIEQAFDELDLNRAIQAYCRRATRATFLLVLRRQGDLVPRDRRHALAPEQGDVAGAIERLQTLKVYPLDSTAAWADPTWIDMTPDPPNTTPHAWEDQFQYRQELHEVVAA